MYLKMHPLWSELCQPTVGLATWPPAQVCENLRNSTDAFPGGPDLRQNSLSGLWLLIWSGVFAHWQILLRKEVYAPGKWSPTTCNTTPGLYPYSYTSAQTKRSQEIHSASGWTLLNRNSLKDFGLRLQSPCERNRALSNNVSGLHSKQRDFQGTLQHLKLISWKGTALLCRKGSCSSTTGAGKFYL